MAARRSPDSLGALELVLIVTAVLACATAAAASASSAPGVTQAYATALDAPSVTARSAAGRGSAPQDANETTTALTDDGPRRRREGWDMLGPGLLVGGTLALLVLAAVGHLASKALLASMLSAALSAVQLARPPPPNRPG